MQEPHLADAGRDAPRAADAVIAGIERHLTESLGTDETARLRALLDRVNKAVRDA